MAMVRRVGKVLRDTKGGTAIEYGLIAAVVVIAMLAALIAFAHGAIDIWDNVADKVVNAGT